MRYTYHEVRILQYEAVLGRLNRIIQELENQRSKVKEQLRELREAK